MLLSDLSKALKRFAKEYGELEVVSIKGNEITLKSHLKSVNRRFGYILYNKIYYIKDFNENEQYDLVFEIL